MLSLLLACQVFKTPADPYDTGSDSGDTSTDSGETDSGETGSSDSGDSGDSGDTDPPPECDPIAPQAPLDACITQTLSCGDRIEGSTLGGTRAFDAGEYQAWYCLTIPDGDYGGLERAYAFTHPGTGNVTFTLDAPCEELDLFVLRWEYWESDEDCPTEDNVITDCELESGGGTVSVWNNDDWNYIVVVEGAESPETRFTLSVTCE